MTRPSTGVSTRRSRQTPAGKAAEQRREPERDREADRPSAREDREAGGDRRSGERGPQRRTSLGREIEQHAEAEAHCERGKSRRCSISCARQAREPAAPVAATDHGAGPEGAGERDRSGSRCGPSLGSAPAPPLLDFTLERPYMLHDGARPNSRVAASLSHPICHGRPRSSPASLPRPPASCTSAARARRCSTGSTPGTPAARCCCASRTPTASARPTRRPTAILDGLTLARPRLGRRGRSTSSRARARHREVAEELRAHAARPITATRRPHELEAMRETARAEGRPPRYDGRWRDRDPVRGAGRRQAGDPPQGAARGRDGRRRPGAGRRAFGRTRISTISSSCARTARRPTCSRSSSTTTTWASPTSSAATTT